jgi:Lysyl oxidase
MARRCSLALALLALAAPAAHAEEPVRPDLVAKAPTEEGLEFDATGGRLLLRFDGYVHNAGLGALELRALSPVDGTMSDVRQRLFLADGVAFTEQPSAARVIYETNDQHAHFHFQQAVRYSLWSEDRLNQVAPAAKVGFCLEDSNHLDAHGPATAVYKVGQHPEYDFCGFGDPESPSVMLGLSPGWEDVYGWNLAFQWVDVSNVAPGRYWLANETDAEGVILEADELNPIAFAGEESVVPGWKARPIDAGVVGAGAGTPIQLAADGFGNPPAPEFKVVDAPDHGTLDRPTGQWFGGGALVYTPEAGYSGPDSFGYVARDPTSPFPTSPPQAAVGLSVAGSPTAVLLSGAPAELRAGRGVQLSASVSNGPQQVSWSRDAGTITQDGFYTAPASVPAGGLARVRATAVTGAFDEAAIRILPAPAEEPAPSVRGRSKRGGRRNPLAVPRLARHGSQLLVRVRSARAGRMRITALRRARRLGGCRVRAPAGRAVLCRVRLRGRLAHSHCARGLRAVVALRVRGRVVAVRRAKL